MKRMKRVLSALLATVLAVSLFTVPTTAATSEETLQAKVLYELGLFKGYDTSGTNFGLDDSMTRQQALVILIRLLGEEKAALAWTGEKPYSDVPSDSTMLPYIGYAKDKGYTKGIGNGKFGMGQLANMNQMTTFALRGLGYSDADGDFTIATSVPFAKTLGVLDSDKPVANFDRGNAVDILFGAIGANVKGQEYDLLSKLMNQGAVTQAQYDKAMAIAEGKSAVTGVKLDKTTATVSIGSTLQLTGTISPTTALNKNVTWTSSSTAIATVSSTGLVKGIKAGTATITVKTADGGKTATCKVTVATPKPVTGVTLNKTTASLAAGATLQLTPTVAPADAGNKNVTWTTSSSSIATVSNTGLVTGVKAGTATITVKTVDGSKTATCKVTVTGGLMTGTFKLINSTGKTITELYMSDSAAKDYGKNIIPGGLSTSNYFNANITFDAQTKFDVYLRFSDGTEAEALGIDFAKATSSGGSITFTATAATLRNTSNTSLSSVTLSKKSATTNVTVTLYNMTGKTWTSLTSSSSKLTSWGSNLLGGPVYDNTSVQLVFPVSAADPKFDLLASYNGGDYEFRELDMSKVANGTTLYLYLENGTPMISMTKPATQPTVTTKTVTIHNYTGSEITALYSTSKTVQNWGSSLGGIREMGSMRVEFTTTATDYTFDLMASTSKGNYEFTDLNLNSVSNGANFYLYLNGATPMISNTKPAEPQPTSRTINVTFSNNSGKELTGFEVSADGRTTSAETLANGGTVTYEFTVPSTETPFTANFICEGQRYTLPFSFGTSVQSGATLTVNFTLSKDGTSIEYSQS